MAKKASNGSDDAEATARRLAEFSTKRASDHEERRFAKKQQWAVTAAGLGIMLALYTAATNTPLGSNESVIVSGLILITPLACIYFLWSLQEHLSKVRLALNPNDKRAFRRGLDILGIFAVILIIGSALFWYALHRSP